MTEACLGLLKTDRPSADECLRGTEEIKRCYAQLMRIRRADLTNLLDAFFPNAKAQTLIRTVSAEEGERAPYIIPVRQKNLLQTFNAQPVRNSIAVDIVRLGHEHNLNSTQSWNGRIVQ